MYKNILVCLDGSEQDDLVGNAALWLAEALKADLHALHVQDLMTLEGPLMYDLSGSISLIPQMDLMQATRKFMEERGQTILGGFAKRCAERRIPCKTYLEEGLVHKVILDKSQLHDLTLLGRRGLNYKLDRELMGSTTDRVVRRTTAPLLVITHQFDAIRSPLLAYDGSQASREAMVSAIKLLADLKLPVTVLNVNSDAEEGKKILEEAKEYLDAYPLVVKYDCVPGTPRQEVPEYAKRHAHDLIILGPHGHRGLMKMILGSTTEYVLWQGAAHILIDR